MGSEMCIRDRYTVARKQQSHMISGGKSTKSFDMCLKSMTLFLLAPHPTFRRPPKRPIAANKRTLDVATRRIQICKIRQFSLHITSSYKSSLRFRRKTKSIHFPVKYNLLMLLLQSDVVTRALSHPDISRYPPHALTLPKHEPAQPLTQGPKTCP